MYYYLEFKLCYLNNLKLFSILIKKIFETIVTKQKTKTRRIFAVFLKHFLENPIDLLVTLGDLTAEKRKIGEGNLYSTENRCSGNEMWCAVVNHNHIRHIMCKRIFRFKLYLGSYWQNIIFLNEFAPNFTY